LSLSGRGPAVTVDLRPSVLETIAESVGPVPRVLLRDTAPGEAHGPVLRSAPEADPSIRYRIDGEIARGGMGCVLKGRDPDLNRDVALKVLRDELRDRPEAVRRFVEEAQIGGQLQHPGIVPIYELGTMADRRPFFSMKLVKGHTLAALLRGRERPADNLPRFLAIFEQVCQTVAYAHARGVIHRDLKPSNVMVGSFGEVQVMDWGLAKVLARGEADDEPHRVQAPDETVVETTVRSGSDADASRAGSIIGTAAYMPPEQARGEITRVDERADVFALGSILCELLTGQPAYAGSSSSELVQRAANADLSDALAHLDACGADAELVALARSCLAPAVAARPRDAGAVAAAIGAYLAGVQARLKKAELARVEAQARADEEAKRRVLSDRLAAEAQARAEEEARRRRLQRRLAAAVLVVCGLAGYGAFDGQRRAQQAETRGELAAGKAVHRLNEARRAWSERLDVTPWTSAEEAAETARELAGTPLRRPLRGLLRSLAARIAAEARTARADADLLAALTAVRTVTADPSYDTADEYRRAFLDHGLDLASGDGHGDPALIDRLRGRPRPFLEQLASSVDVWVLSLRPRDTERPLRRRLTAFATAIDGDPWRNELRTVVERTTASAARPDLLRLAGSADLARQSATTLNLLAAALLAAGEIDTAIRVLEPARFRHRDDPWIYQQLGNAYISTRPPRTEDALRAYTAATALRPEMGYALAIELRNTGRTEEAIAVMQEATQRRPGFWSLFRLGGMQAEREKRAESADSFARALSLARESVARHPNDYSAHNELGTALAASGDRRGALAALREASRLKPDSPDVPNNIGNILKQSGDLDGAIAAYREAIRLGSDKATTHYNLGSALRETDDLDGALAAFREAIRLEPGFASAHSRLGTVLRASGDLRGAIAAQREALRLKPDSGEAYCNLGNALLRAGDVRGALAACREAIRLEPDSPEAHNNLGAALSESGDVRGAVTACREAVRLKPDFAEAQNNLGNALRMSGDLRGAIAACREGVRLKPSFAEAHYNLGNALATSRDQPGAVEAFREAVRLKPGFADAHANLGLALSFTGKMREAITACREAIRLQPDLAGAHNNLGVVLAKSGDMRGAATAFREAVRLKPDLFEPRNNLGKALSDSGDLPGALAAYREAIRLKPDTPETHSNLGLALDAAGDKQGALAACREAVRLKPELAVAHYNLGNVQRHWDDVRESISAYREAIRLDPGYPEAHCNLGHAFQSLGQFAEALPEFQRGHELGSQRPEWPYPSARWVERCRRQADLAARLPAILSGRERPADAAERIELATVALATHWNRAAAGLFADAFTARPALADAAATGQRYNAACAAALAGCGKGEDDPKPDEPERTRLRKQALDWLKADLLDWSKRLGSDANLSREQVARVMEHWKADSDLAGVRDAEPLAEIPGDERKSWQAFWSEVETLLSKARQK
jgi:serine/threonine-protein kinase